MPAQSGSTYHGAAGYGQADASHQQYFNPTSLSSYGAQGYGHGGYTAGYAAGQHPHSPASYSSHPSSAYQYGHQQHHMSPAQAQQYSHMGAYGSTGHLVGAGAAAAPAYASHYGVAPTIPNPGQVTAQTAAPAAVNRNPPTKGRKKKEAAAPIPAPPPPAPTPAPAKGSKKSSTKKEKAAPAAAPAPTGKKAGKAAAGAKPAKGTTKKAAAAAAAAAAAKAKAQKEKEKEKERKKKEKEEAAKKQSKPPTLRSHLKPPKQAPSAWQVYFTEELQKMKAAQPGERLNVAHVAKDAGARYAALPDSAKDEYQRKSLELKAEWEKEMEKWRQTLTPEDIKQENMYRTAQRKAGKSRKGNLKDPHAPKKPLSAYFLFLRAIRGDSKLTDQVFGGETETTKQSVLAAAKWRSLPENEKRPYLEKAEADKAKYEKARRDYEIAHGIAGPPQSGSGSGGGSSKSGGSKSGGSKKKGKPVPGSDSGDSEAAAAAMTHVPEPPAAGVDFGKIEGFDAFGNAQLGDAFGKPDGL